MDYHPPQNPYAQNPNYHEYPEPPPYRRTKDHDVITFQISKSTLKEGIVLLSTCISVTTALFLTQPQQCNCRTDAIFSYTSRGLIGLASAIASYGILRYF